MSTSVGTKTKKKQLSLLKTPAQEQESKQQKALEMVMLNLETVCLMILESEFAPPAEDATCRAARQRFINVASPVSLALMECKGGPRHFHHHYRHKPGDDSILQPILENPTDSLALACHEATKPCHEDLLGLRDPDLRQTRQAFQQALHNFLAIYNIN